MAQQITRRRFLAEAAALTTLPAISEARSRRKRLRSRRPNIILIMVDDLGYGDLGCYGCTDIRTPNIDKLADGGVRFTTFYANAPECSPTRTALLTGRYQHRVGGLECALGIGNVGRYDDAIRLRETHDLGLPPDETSIARMLKNAGYATGISGKWHLGYEPEFFPLKHGFDHWFGPVGGAVDYFHHDEYTGKPALYLDDRPVKRQGYLTDLITQDAAAFIKRNTSKPFFLYVAYTAPHTPYQGPDDKKPQSVPQADYNKGTRATFVKMVERMDDGVGKITGALRAADLTKNTLIIFMSDNGANKKGNNSPYSGYKGNLFEGGIRVPCIAAWPGIVKPGTTSDQPCITMDFSRSILAAAKAAPPTDRPFDGIDILAEVAANSPVKERTLFWRARRAPWTRKAVRHGSLKYISLQNDIETREYLFDLAADPAEKNNLLTDRPEDLHRLKNLLKDWEQKVKHKR